MKKIFSSKLILIVITSILICACADSNDEFDIETSNILPDGRIKLLVDYNIAGSNIIETKAADSDYETKINNAVFLLFEAGNENYQLETDRLLQVVKADINSNTPVSKLSFIVPFYYGKCRVKVIANLDYTTLNKVLNYNTYPNSNTPATILDFKELTAPVELINKEKINSYLPLMSDEPAVLNGINGQTNLSIFLNRIYSRIDLKIDPSVNNFKLHEVHIVNSAKSGRFEPYQRGEFPEYSIGDFTSYYSSSYDNINAGPLYLYENLDSYYSEAVPTTIIIKGTYEKDGNTTPGYYNVFIEYKKGSDYFYTINRNSRFNITIKKVNHFGYQTFEEAKFVPSENTAVEMDIEVDDLNFSGDILYHSSGYALSSTNSEAHIYAASAETVYSAATLNFMKNSNHPNQFRPEITLKVLNPNSDFEIVNINEIINQQLNVPVNLNVRFKKPSVSATVEVRFGGLRKLITINSFKMLRCDSQQPIEIDNVLNVQYSESINSYKWFKFNTVQQEPSSDLSNLTFEQPSKIFCITNDNNYLTRTSTPILVFRGNNLGTLKIIATQTYGSYYMNELYYDETGDKNSASHKEKRANCLMLPTVESRSYKVTGCRAYDFYKETNELHALNNCKAEIVWADFNFKDPNPFEPHNIIEVENIKGNYEEIILRIRNYHANAKNSGNANFIWGLKDENNKWIWSWHVWLSDLVEEVYNQQTYKQSISYTGYSYISILADKYELSRLFYEQNVVSEKSHKTHYNNEYRVYMDRNLGAKTSAYVRAQYVSYEDATKHFGLFYQHGRKDALPSTQYIVDYNPGLTPDIKIYTPQYPNGIEYTDKIPSENIQYTIQESINNPLTFFATGYNLTDWCSSSDKKRWVKGNGKGEKSIYDPSPYGWRVNWGDGYDLYTDNMKWHNFIPDNYNKKGGGIFINSYYWFPAVGTRSSVNGIPGYFGDYGWYWSGSAIYYNGNYLAYLSDYNFDRRYESSFVTQRYRYVQMSYGCSIRSVLDL